jgi:acyl-CoA thioesterase FadM
MLVPEAAEALDADHVADATETCFGLEHTDSNQHVNSLVYPRLFAEAALRRLAAMGESRAVLVRELDIAYRKPSFAGDRVRVHQRMFRVGGKLGAAGYLAADGETKPRVCARILLG